MLKNAQPGSPGRIGKNRERMIWIPAGWFLIGTSEKEIVEMVIRFKWKAKWFADEMPQHPAYLNAYSIDETPITNAEYKRFLDANPNHVVPPDWNKESRTRQVGKEKHPVVCVSWNDADDYAHWVGKQLPTEAEWERAARGTDGRRFPWGDEFDPGRSNTSESKLYGTTPVKNYAQMGNSADGVIDMAGNVWEWCADWYDAMYYKNAPTHNPQGPDSGDWRVLRGGAWDVAPDYSRCASRDYIVPDGIGYATVGFRCVQSMNEEKGV